LDWRKIQNNVEKEITKIESSGYTLKGFNLFN